MAVQRGKCCLSVGHNWTGCPGYFHLFLVHLFIYFGIIIILFLVSVCLHLLGFMVSYCLFSGFFKYTIIIIIIKNPFFKFIIGFLVV